MSRRQRKTAATRANKRRVARWRDFGRHIALKSPMRSIWIGAPVLNLRVNAGRMLVFTADAVYSLEPDGMGGFTREPVPWTGMHIPGAILVDDPWDVNRDGAQPANTVASLSHAEFGG